MKVHAQNDHAIPRCHRFLPRRHILVRIARTTIDSSRRLGRHRWVVERILAWLNRYQWLIIRDERRVDIHPTLISLACCQIYFNAIQRLCRAS